MSQKRKIEEYHDPDYAQHIEKRSRCDVEERNQKILDIIRREFKIELDDREKEVLEIEKRLAEAKKQLDTLKFAAVKNFYKKGELSRDVRTESYIPPEENLPGDDISLHPAIKKLIGKTPRKYSELMSPVPARKAAQDATSLVRQVCSRAKKKEEKLPTPKVETVSFPESVRKEEKPMVSLNSSRGRNQERHLIVVGNTSKYIGENKISSSVSHKWLVYVQTKSSHPLENLVERVCFFLHPTYQPNDRVDLQQPPFKISRFGWGEFTIRVQLHFRPEMRQKPVQIFHTVKLDENNTGLETLGAETMAELWLNRISPKTEAEEEEMMAPPEIFSTKEEIKEESRISIPDGTLREISTDYLKIEDLPSHIFDHCYSRKRHSESERLSHLFNQVPFESVRSGVEFLLRRLPLVSSNSPWRFSFISPNQAIFQNHHWAKRFSKEWFRAKLINRLMRKHPGLRILPEWSTKEIVIFARQYFYIPAADTRRQSSSNLQEMLKEEIKWEKITSSTTTDSSSVWKWISQNSSVKEIPDEEEVIDVDNLDTPGSSGSQNKPSEPSGRRGRNFWTVEDVLLERIKDSDLQDTLRVVLTVFLEDLLRRSAANVIDNSAVRVDHVKLAALSRPEFDFLTNRSLGTTDNTP